MFTHYYFVKRDRLNKYVHDHQPLASWNAVETDEPGTLLILASFREQQDSEVFIAHAGAEPMEKPMTRKAIGKAHANRLGRFGVTDAHTTFEVSDKVEAVSGKFMRLPNY